MRKGLPRWAIHITFEHTHPQKFFSMPQLHFDMFQVEAVDINIVLIIIIATICEEKKWCHTSQYKAIWAMLVSKL